MGRKKKPLSLCGLSFSLSKGEILERERGLNSSAKQQQQLQYGKGSSGLWQKKKMRTMI